MAGELIAQFNAFTLNRESSAGFNASFQLVTAGAYRGVSLQKLIQSQLQEYYSFSCVVPAAAALATGITVVLNIVDDTTSSLDPGTVVDIGVTAQNLSAAGAMTNFTTGTGVEQTGTVTLSATSRNPVQISIAIANAQLSSLAVGNILGLRIRRLGDNASDTCNGRAVLLSGMVKNT
jgi:hypothetical protein